GQNGRLITNFKKLVVPDVAPAPKPFNGQFIQVDVVDVKYSSVQLPLEPVASPPMSRAKLCVGICLLHFLAAASMAAECQPLSNYFPPPEDQGGWRSLLPESGD